MEGKGEEKGRKIDMGETDIERERMKKERKD